MRARRLRSGSYRPPDLILALLFAVMIGLRRINKTEILQYTARSSRCWAVPVPRPVHAPAVSQTAYAQRHPAPRGLHDRLRRVLFPVRSAHFVDLRSGFRRADRLRQTPIRPRRVQPKKRGRRSYHPLLCFEAHLQEFWHGSLRPGNAASSSGVVAFTQRCLQKAPRPSADPHPHPADSGFFGGTFIASLDRSGVGYAIVAREYSTIKAYAGRADSSAGHRLGGERVHLQAAPLESPHRFVVVRRPIPEIPWKPRN